MHAVGFEPTHLAIPELESGPLDHSGIHAYTVQASYIETASIFENIPYGYNCS